MAFVAIGTTDALLSPSGLVSAVMGKAVSRCPKNGKRSTSQGRKVERKWTRGGAPPDCSGMIEQNLTNFEVVLVRILSRCGGCIHFSLGAVKREDKESAEA